MHLQVAKGIFYNSHTPLALADVQEGCAHDQLVLGCGLHSTLERTGFAVGFHMHNLTGFVLVHVEVLPC